MMNIVLCASDNYTMPCGVTICSICENNSNHEINFYIITDNSFSEDHKMQLRELISKYPLKSIDFLIVPDEKIDQFVKYENHWWTRHVFYRLLAADLLPSFINKVLYLDCDIIVRHSLDKLWETDLTNKAIGCVPDGMEGIIEYYNRLEYTSEKGYFNSGVLLINLTYWREYNISNQFANYIYEHGDKIKYPDQDVLNAVLKDNKVILPLTYNFQSTFLYKPKFRTFDYTKYKNQITTTYDDPIVLHLSGVRPWISGRMIHPYQQEFFKYRALTIWKDESLWPCNYTLKRRFIDKLRPILSKIGICNVIESPYDTKYQLKQQS